MTGLSEKDRALMERTLDNVDRALLTPSLHQEIILSRLLQAARSEGQGEPVAWMGTCETAGLIQRVRWLAFTEEEARNGAAPDVDPGIHPLFTTPPDPQARIEALEKALSALVEEFGGTIEQYHKIGPDYTLSAGTEVFEVSAILDREPLIEAARAVLTGEKEGEADGR